MTELRTRITYVHTLGNQVHPMIHALFPNNDTVFQDDNAHIYAAGNIQSWFKEHEDEIKYLPWPEQSPYLNITEPIRSVLETRLRNRFPTTRSLKQLEDILQEE
jgi:hypothetical protein